MKLLSLFIDLTLVALYGTLLTYLFGKPVVLIGYLMLFVMILLFFYLYTFMSRCLKPKFAQITFFAIKILAIIVFQSFIHASIYPPYSTLKESLSSLKGYKDIKYEDIIENNNPITEVVALYKYQYCLPEKFFVVFLSYLPDRSFDKKFVIEHSSDKLQALTPDIEMIEEEELKVNFRECEIILKFKEEWLFVKEFRCEKDKDKIRIGIVERKVPRRERMPKYFDMLRRYLKIKHYPIVKSFNCVHSDVIREK